MDKLVAELIELLRGILAAQGRMLAIANSRQAAMCSLNLEQMDALLVRERNEVTQFEALESRRRILVERFKPELGRQVNATTGEIARRCPEPLKSQVLGLAAQVKAVAEELTRVNRINSSASQAVANGFSKVLKIVTGVAQQAGLYMANGRKVMADGMHLLDAVA